jgi:hypothetical protein
MADTNDKAAELAAKEKELAEREAAVAAREAEMKAAPEKSAVVRKPKPTTEDEGKTFDKPTLFVCVQDCVHNGLRYHPGDEVSETKCPPYFRVKPTAAEEKAARNRSGKEK